jgi:hypothetical protein
MFTNPVYNLPPKFNENLLAQNLAGVSLNSPSLSAPQFPIEIGGYTPPSLDESSTKWPSPDDVNASYQRGSTVVRQYNNSMIDDYYKKFLRPITDYIPIPTNGQPTYVYQNLGGTPGVPVTAEVSQPAVAGGLYWLDKKILICVYFVVEVANDATEGKKHKKKHKKRSLKREDGEKTTDESYDIFF